MGRGCGRGRAGASAGAAGAGAGARGAAVYEIKYERRWSMEMVWLFLVLRSIYHGITAELRDGHIDTQAY